MAEEGKYKEGMAECSAEAQESCLHRPYCLSDKGATQPGLRSLG